MSAVIEELGTIFFEGIRSARRRPFQQFAEEEVVVATGPRKGVHFSCHFMPWTVQVFEEFDRGFYRRFFASGPVQSGKTLVFFIIPIMYHLFECGENVIVGVPKIDMAQGIWEERILPSIEASKYVFELPTTGAGSRGGKFVAVRFQNGAVLRFMGAGGGDAQRSSHTSRVVVLTEIDKMDTPGAVSREADPVTQIEARTRSFGDAARIYGECTMSTEYGRIYQEVVKYGTDTRIQLRCPRCEGWVLCERSGFGGWQNAEDVVAARAGALYTCPACGGEWSESDRQSALRVPILVSKGQAVSQEGKVEGPAPATTTWGFRWNAMHNSLISMADIADAEFRAERSGNPEDRKALEQFTWAEPYEEKLVDLSGLSRDYLLREKINSHARGRVPTHATKLTVAIDLGLHRCWWLAAAWTEDAQGYVIDYGSIDVPHGQKVSTLAILTSLRGFRDDVLVPGWQTPEGAPRRPDLVVVDSGWEPDVAYRFVRETRDLRVLPSKGLGSGKRERAWNQPKPGKGLLVGRDWVIAVQPGGIRLLEIHSDYWKRQTHAGYGAPMLTPGSISVFRGEQRDHLGFVGQITAEREEEEFVPGKGNRIFWRVIDKNNHWFDCSYMNRAAADVLGIRLKDPEAPPVQRPPTPVVQPRRPGRRIRTKYS